MTLASKLRRRKFFLGKAFLTFGEVIWIASVSAQGGLEPGGRHCHGPVDDIGVDVVQPKVLQGGLQVNADMLRTVVGVPKLCLDEQVLPE